MKHRLLLVCWLLTLVPISLLARDKDSIRVPEFCRVRPQQVIVPAAMIGLGAVVISNHRLSEMKYDVRDAMQRGRGSHHKVNIETWATLGAQLTVVGLGKKPKHSFVDRMLVKITSYALLYTTMPVVRRCVHEPRPDGHGDHAFLSIKTAAAFMAAEQTRVERGWGGGMGMYAFATGIGVMQMYNDRCYINDVLAGAGAGILSCHAAYWLLPYERRMFGLDKRKRNRPTDTPMMLVPTFEYNTRTVGLSFAAVF